MGTGISGRMGITIKSMRSLLAAGLLNSGGPIRIGFGMVSLQPEREED